MNSKKVLEDRYYTFDPLNRVITFYNMYINKKDLLLITNLSDNKIIYNFACSTEGGTLTNNILTLVYNTTEMSSSDRLMIIVTEEDKKESYLKEIRDSLKDLNEILISKFTQE